MVKIILLLCILFLFQEYDLETKCQSLNIWQDARYRILSIDKKSHSVLLKVLVAYWANFNKELGEILEEVDLFPKMRIIADQMENALLNELIKDKDDLPIFDYEF